MTVGIMEDYLASRDRERSLAAAAGSLQSHLLTPEQKAQMGLEQDEAYIQVFILNDKQNKAVQPEPFKVARSAVDKIARTAVGRPFIVGPDPRHHVVGATGTAEEVIRIQQKYAVGEFVQHWVNPATGNAHGIVRIFPEFVKKAREGRIPPFVSPMIEVYRRDPATDEITDGRIIHVQAVASPGYSPAVAKISGACVGMLDECSAKLRVLAAAGKLQDHQRKIVVAASGYGDLENHPAIKDLQRRINELRAASGGFDRRRKQEREDANSYYGYDQLFEMAGSGRPQ